MMDSVGLSSFSSDVYAAVSSSPGSEAGEQGGDCVWRCVFDGDV